MHLPLTLCEEDHEDVHIQQEDDWQEHQDGANNNVWNQEFNGHNTNNVNGFDEDIGGNYGGEVAVVKKEKVKIGNAFDAPLTPEEEARISEVEMEQRARMQKLIEREANEVSEKRATKDRAKKELKKWYEDKERDRVAKSKQNKEEEWAFLKQREEHKRSKNKWEKIIDNVEINANKYLGSKDVSRMRQSMLARKADLKAQGEVADD